MYATNNHNQKYATIPHLLTDRQKKRYPDEREEVMGGTPIHVSPPKGPPPGWKPKTNQQLPPVEHVYYGTFLLFIITILILSIIFRKILGTFIAPIIILSTVAIGWSLYMIIKFNNKDVNLFPSNAKTGDEIRAEEYMYSLKH